MAKPDWSAGHENHRIVMISVSSGEKAQCEDCKTVIAWWPENSASDEPLPWIPASIGYTPYG